MSRPDSAPAHPPTSGAAVPAFDTVADCYDAALNEGLSVTGETKEYFARERVALLARRLAERGLSPRSALDFGCGTGSGVPFLLAGLGVRRLLGVDISPASLAVAEREHGSANVRFATLAAAAPESEYELAFCNGVFHHIPPAERPGALAYVHQALVPGGIFALWENNPWNPGTRYIMRRVSFDRDAITLTPPETRRMLGAAGFDVLATDFRFYFPHALRALRWIEPALTHLPLGGQYQVLARKRAE